MTNKHLCTLFVLATFSTAGTASAAEFLTAEFQFAAEAFGMFHQDPPSSLALDFSIGSGRWHRNTTVSDTGQTFSPEPDQLALMAAEIAAANPNSLVVFGVNWGPSLPYEFGFRGDVPGQGCYSTYPNPCLTLYAPTLQSYPLSAVRITIDDFATIQQVSSWTYRVGLTARLYGVPEPTGFVTTFLALLWFAGRHCRGTPHQPVPVA